MLYSRPIFILSGSYGKQSTAAIHSEILDGMPVLQQFLTPGRITINFKSDLLSLPSFSLQGPSQTVSCLTFSTFSAVDLGRSISNNPNLT